MRKTPFGWTAYALATRAAQPFANRFLDARGRRGKEDAERRGERLGVAGVARPEGKLAWLHGASVGECVSLLPLVDWLRGRGAQVLMTSGTTTSATLMARRLPPGAIHQYLPLDAPSFVKRFLSHWRPDLALFAESELWPNLLMATKRSGAAVMLVNARMSERSFQRWRRMPSMIGSLLGHIDLVMAQSDEDAFRFGALGAEQVLNCGNLKFDAPPPPADAIKLAALSASVAGRPVWFAASTHPGEDEHVLSAHARIVERLPDMLTIIAPRHPERGRDIAEMARMDGLSATLRSRDGLPTRATGVYVADTLGELGLFYRLSPVAFIGATLVDKGGHNPVEPAKLGVAILHGRYVTNAVDSYAALDRDGGALLVSNADDIAREVVALIGDVGRLRAMGGKAYATVEALSGATARIAQAIEPFFPSRAPR